MTKSALHCNAVLLVISKCTEIEHMQSLLQERKIEDSERKDALLEILVDKYCRAIIETTMEKPKSAMEIAADAKIPISTVYRRLQILHDNKVVAISGMISDDGKKFFLYKSKVRSVSASYTGNYVEVQVVPNIPSVTKEWFFIRWYHAW